MERTANRNPAKGCSLGRGSIPTQRESREALRRELKRSTFAVGLTGARK